MFDSVFDGVDVYTCLREELRNNLDVLTSQPNNLFLLDVSKSDMWSTYINAYPEQVNVEGSQEPIYVRQSNNCNSCKSFINRYGNLVHINPETFEITNIWGMSLDLAPAKAMYNLLSVATIRDAFLPEDLMMGNDRIDYVYKEKWNKEFTWTHLAYTLPTTTRIYTLNVSKQRSDIRSSYDTFKASLQKINNTALNTVLDLLDENKIGRGQEKRHLIEEFKDAKALYDSLTSFEKKEAFLWWYARNKSDITHFKNDVIGTLLVDISDIVGTSNYNQRVERLVDTYNRTRVNAENYQVTVTAASNSQIDRGQKLVEELGLLPSLYRRFAEDRDLHVNDLLFTKRVSDPNSLLGNNPFDLIKSPTVVNPASLRDLQTVSFNELINDILPKLTDVEILFNDDQTSNLVSLIGPLYPDSPNIFKWGNRYSLCYNGALADSGIKELVKLAGGNVNGFIRISLRWYNGDDEDLRLHTPKGILIFFGNKSCRQVKWELDVDMNAGYRTNSINPVENITHPHGSYPDEGIYRVEVNNYSKRDKSNTHFEVEIECGDTLWHFEHPGLQNGATAIIAEFEYSKNTNNITLFSGNPSYRSDADANNRTNKGKSREVWGLKTNVFYPVKSICLSPNYWSGNVINDNVTDRGNKHLLFFVQGCINPNQKVSGFFNEFLRSDLYEHRRVFQMLSEKMPLKNGDDTQLSGLGFSSSKPAEFILRVKGEKNGLLRVVV